MSFTTDVCRRVYDDREGACVEVRPCPDNPTEFLEIHTPDDKSKEFYGDFRISFPKEMARQLGAALIAGASNLPI